MFCALQSAVKERARKDRRFDKTIISHRAWQTVVFYQPRFETIRNQKNIENVNVIYVNTFFVKKSKAK